MFSLSESLLEEGSHSNLIVSYNSPGEIDLNHFFHYSDLTFAGNDSSLPITQRAEKYKTYSLEKEISLLPHGKLQLGPSKGTYTDLGYPDDIYGT